MKQSRPSQLANVALVCLCLFAFAATARGQGQKTPGNPAPAPDDLVLPMPGGLTMTFRPVFIGAGDTAFSIRRIILGGNGENYKETPTALGLGGAFRGTHKGKSDWLYYIGKYEITQAQYDAVMGQGGRTHAANGMSSDGSLPAVNLSYQDAQLFIDRYNQWLFAHALNKLPTNESPGYLRLPTEAEWEFAARGGSELPENQFDSRTPYQGNLTEYEWFAGPASAHNELQPVGKLRPNPLGIHDMLGNAAEMTDSLYQIEYFQGRVGGFTARGGSYRTSQRELRSSLRSEQPFYQVRSNGGLPEPFRRPDLSFRLVISSLVIPNIAAAESMKQAWDEYRQGVGASLPAALSVAADVTKEDVSKNDALVHVDRLKKELARSGQLNGEPAEELQYIETILLDLDHQRREADERQAYATTVVATERARLINEFLRKISEIDTLVASHEKDSENAGYAQLLTRWKTQRRELDESLQEALEKYGSAQRDLAHYLPQSVDKAFETVRQNVANIPFQKRLFEVVTAHARIFLKSKRADTETWRKEIAAVSR